MLTIPCGIFNAGSLYLLQEVRVLRFQSGYFCINGCYSALCLGNLCINLGGIDTLRSDGGSHGALLSVGIDAAAALRALVLGGTFTQFGAVMAGDADGCRLASCHLLRIGGLVVSLAVTANVVSDAVFVVIVVGKTGVQACSESGHVHGIGVEDILIFDFLPVP